MLKKMILQNNINYSSLSMPQNIKMKNSELSKSVESKNRANILKNASEDINTSPKFGNYFKLSDKKKNLSKLKLDCNDDSLNIINLFINGIKYLKSNDTLSYTIKLMKLNSYLQKNGHSYKIVSNYTNLSRYLSQKSIQLLTNDKHLLKNVRIETLHHVYMLYLFNGFYKLEKYQTFQKPHENSKELKTFLEELIDNEKCPSSTKSCSICQTLKEIFNKKNNINNFKHFSFINTNQNTNQNNTPIKNKMNTQTTNHNKKIQRIKQKLINDVGDKNKNNVTNNSVFEKNLTSSKIKNTAPLTNKIKRKIGIKVKNSALINNTYKKEKEKQQRIKTEPNDTFIKYIKKTNINGTNCYKINYKDSISDSYKPETRSKSNSAEQPSAIKKKSIFNNDYDYKAKSKIFLQKQALYPNSLNKNNENIGSFKDVITIQDLQKMVNGNIFINYNISTIFKDSSKKEQNTKYYRNKDARKANTSRNSFVINTTNSIKTANIGKIYNKVNKNQNNERNAEINKEFKYDDNYFIINKDSFVKTRNIDCCQNINNNDMVDIDTYANEIENRINYMKNEINMFKEHNNEIKQQLYNLNNKNNV